MHFSCVRFTETPLLFYSSGLARPLRRQRHAVAVVRSQHAVGGHHPCHPSRRALLGLAPAVAPKRCDASGVGVERSRRLHLSASRTARRPLHALLLLHHPYVTVLDLQTLMLQLLLLRTFPLAIIGPASRFRRPP